MNRTIHFLLLSVGSSLLCGCNLFPPGAPGGPVNPPSLNLVKNTLDVSVVPPVGVAMPTQVKTGLGTVNVASGAAPATPIFDEGPQFAMATVAEGHAQLMGFVGPGAAELNTRTTAEVLLYFSLQAFLLPSDARGRVLELLRTEPAVTPLADAIGTALAADPLALATGSAQIKTALDSALQQIKGAAGPTSKSKDARISRVLVDRPGAQSGISVLDQDLTSVIIRNEYRRRAAYFVERVGYVPEGGTDEVPSPAKLGKADLSQTYGVTSVFGMLLDVAAGNIAYAPVDSGPISLPVYPENAKYTHYQIKVVGIGAHPGDQAQLDTEQKDECRRLTNLSFVADFLVPLFTNVMMPLTAGKWDALIGSPYANDLIADVITYLFSNAASALDKASLGDVKGAFEDVYTNIIGAESTRVVFLHMFYGLFVKMNILTSAEESNFKGFLNAFLAPIGAFDAIFSGFDSCVQGVTIAVSNRAEIFHIKSDRTKVKLDPPFADIDAYHSQVFRAEIPAASGLDATIVYHWKCTGDHGGIRDNQHDSKEFDSTEKAVTYFPKVPPSPGVDTITVEAFEVQGQNRVSIGTATADVKVRALAPTLVPDRVSLGKFEGQTFTAKVDSTLSNGGTLTYKWFSSKKFGQVVSPVNYVETTDNTGTYVVTGTPPGEDTVAVEVFSTKDGVKTSLGIARAQVKIEERKTIIMGSFNVEPEFSPPGYTGTPGFTFLTAYVKVPKVEGATSYSVRIYNFYDWAYWVHGTTFGDATVRSAQDRGNAYWISITGGQSRDEHLAENKAGAEARFVGMIVEVTVTY